MKNTSPKIHPNFCYLPQLKVEKANKSAESPKPVFTQPKKTESSSKIYRDLQEKKMKFHENVEKLSLQTICNLQRKTSKQQGNMLKREIYTRKPSSFLDTCVFTSQKLEPKRKTSVMKIGPARFKFPNCPKSFAKSNKFNSTFGFPNLKTEQCEIEPFDGNFKEMDANLVVKTEPCEITNFEGRRSQEHRRMLGMSKQESTERRFVTSKGEQGNLITSKVEQGKFTPNKEELVKLESYKQEISKFSTPNKEQQINLDTNQFDKQRTNSSTGETVTFRKDTSIHVDNEHMNPTMTLMHIEEEDAPIRLQKVEEALQLNSKKYLDVASDFRVHKASFQQIRKALIEALNMIFELKMDLNDVRSQKIFSSKPYQKPGSHSFIRAVKFGNFDDVKHMLLKNRYLVYDYDYVYYTALHWACKRGHFDIVVLLCKVGANTNAKDIIGRPPLYFSLRQGFNKISQVLLFFKADPWSTQTCNIKDFVAKDPVMQRIIHKSRKLQIIAKMTPASKRMRIWEGERDSILMESPYANEIYKALERIDLKN